MPRPMARAVFAKPNQCPACFTTFQDDTVVILLRDGTVLCSRHRDMIVTEAVFAEGPWRDIRTRRGGMDR